MRIVIAGASGFLGQALIDHWRIQGHHLTALVRRMVKDAPGVGQRIWDGSSQGEWTSALENADVLINLCGRSVDCRYTEKNKRQIRDSRIDTTRALGEAVASSERPPDVWINASSATIYRHALDRPMTEAEGEVGDDFSMNIVKAWEKEFRIHARDGVRQVAIRTSIVMGKEGGAFLPLRRLSAFGLGGHQGNGRQMMSWLHVSDFCRAIDYIIAQSDMEGAINVTAPNPLPNKDFMHILRQRMNMPMGLPHPAWMLGIGAFIIRTETELLLKSRWVLPERLMDKGFRFDYPDWSSAAEYLLS